MRGFFIAFGIVTVLLSYALNKRSNQPFYEYVMGAGFGSILLGLVINA